MTHLPQFHPKHMMWLMPLILSGIMSGSISFFNLLMNKGWSDDFIGLWLKTWGMSWLMAFPLILVMLPIVKRVLMKFVAVPPSPQA